MKYLKLYTLSFCVLLSHCIRSQDRPKNNIERKALQMVKNLKEVKAAEAYFLKGKSPLRVYLDGFNNGYYSVRAAQFRGGMTFTQYVFLVDPQKNIIKYWDLSADTVISLTTWRKNNYEIDRLRKKSKRLSR